MEMIIHQTKRVKLEHSYAYSDDSELALAGYVKEEDPLSLSQENDIIQNVKIEIDEDNLIKTEPIEPLPDGEYTFEYLNVPNGNEHEMSPYQLPLENLIKAQNISEIKNVKLNNSVLAVKDPLELMRHEFLVPNKVILEVKKPGEKKRGKDDNLKKDKSRKTEPKSLLQFQKEKDNVQKQIKMLKSDLKTAKTKEKALHIELGARRMSELSLEEKNRILNDQLQESIKREKTNCKLIKELKQTVMQKIMENYNTSKCQANFERLNKELMSKLEECKAKLRKMEYEHKQLDTICAAVRFDRTRIKATFESQKKELDDAKQRLSTTTEAFNDYKLNTQQLAMKVIELNKEIDKTKRGKEDLQKVLLNEQKMNRLFVKERDQLVDEHITKLKDVDKDLARQKSIIGSLTAALTQKISECRTQKETVKVMKLNFQRRSLEFANKVKELEKKESELANKVCEYCGF